MQNRTISRHAYTGMSFCFMPEYKMITNPMVEIQSREDRNETVNCFDTAQEAVVLARDVLAAFARNSDEPALSSAYSIRDKHICSSTPLKTLDEPRVCAQARNRPLGSALQPSPKLELLDGALNGYSNSLMSLEELMCESNPSLTPVAENCDVLNFVKTIDDINATFCGANYQENDICGALKQVGDVREIEDSDVVGKKNNGTDSIEALKHLLDGTSNLTFQPKILELDPFQHTHHGSEKHFGQGALTTNSTKSADNSLGRKNARDRRRAIARRRTLFRRRADEKARMQRIMKGLLCLPEEERQKELMKIEHQRRENEIRRKAEEKRRLGRQAVERCRGKAGLGHKALEMRLKLIRDENQKLRRVIGYLSKSGLVSVEELRKHRIVFATERIMSAMSKSTTLGAQRASILEVTKG
ncbi:hypothetical protein FGB62_34g119 [Gracilaria domingensis]|nr:hypothetical protein FGB62_34g119 [Gracilaria domingensis]